MTVLVTGGAGFIGSHLVDKLIQNGYKVDVMDNLSTGNKNNVNSKADLIDFDVEGNFFEYDYELIFHLAAESRIQPSFSNPKKVFNSNIMGTQHILELAMKQKNKCKVIYAGSSTACNNPYINPYSFTKWVGEETCKMYYHTFNVPVSIARFFNVYGSRHLHEGPHATVLGIFEKQKKELNELTVTGNGQQKRDFIHVSDIVDGLIKISKTDCNLELFNLGSGKNNSILEIAQMFKPKSIKFIERPKGEEEETLADIAFSKEKLNWEPIVEISEYIKNYIVSLDK